MRFVRGLTWPKMIVPIVMPTASKANRSPYAPTPFPNCSETNVGASAWNGAIATINTTDVTAMPTQSHGTPAT